ncbi:hypothetical protein [Nonomuraea salmonea]|uniref:Transposase DDE domain-containing protein n=1 Tax=Nonomuraea salmonea TaxID=46181 RepID=A0ABV5NHJ3_9ACTN
MAIVARRHGGQALMACEHIACTLALINMMDIFGKLAEAASIMAKPWRRVDHHNHVRHNQGSRMLFYRAAVDLSHSILNYVAGLIRRHRKAIGSAWRLLNPGQQALYRP